MIGFPNWSGPSFRHIQHGESSSYVSDEDNTSSDIIGIMRRGSGSESAEIATNSSRKDGEETNPIRIDCLLSPSSVLSLVVQVHALFLKVEICPKVRYLDNAIACRIDLTGCSQLSRYSCIAELLSMAA